MQSCSKRFRLCCARITKPIVFWKRPLIDGALKTPAFEEEQEFVDHVTGRVVSHYRILSHLGHGGMGSVWLAERNDGRFDRRVAIKFLNIAAITLIDCMV
jgi:serine/threonine protein kinase